MDFGVQRQGLGCAARGRWGAMAWSSFASTNSDLSSMLLIIPKTKNAYFLPLSTAPVPCKSQIISNIDDRSELVLSMRCCSQLVRSSWLLFPTSAQLVGNGFAGLSLVPWTSVIQTGRPTFRSYGPISTHI